MTSSKFGKEIDTYMNLINSGTIESNEDIKKAMRYYENILSRDYIFIDEEATEKAIKLVEKYFDIKLFEWERFIFGLVHVYDKRDDTVVFNTFLIMMGRGNGKNGFISCLVWYLTTHYHGIDGYNVDIIANSEDQAKTSFDDILLMLEENWDNRNGIAGLKNLFYKSKVLIKSVLTNSTIKFNTSNASTKDGKRSGCLVFDEIHEYENFNLINVFTSGFGKRKHSRTFYITTNGYVRDGVLDRMLNVAADVLNGDADELGMAPLLYRLNNRNEATDPTKWILANPSLPYLPSLRKEMEKEFGWMKRVPSRATEFYTKRMNLPDTDAYTAVATPEQINATNRPIPLEELENNECVGAVDYASVSDFCSCGLLFKKNGNYYWIEHTFVCKRALELGRVEIKFPVREMAQQGLLTIVNDTSITPDIVADWFLEKAEHYNIIDIRADRYRITLLRAAFEETGLPLTKVAVGARTHNEVAPLLETLFAQNQLIWGDNPVMRWYTYNVYQDRDKKGNIEYKKIEPEARKTDGFFALIHALTGEAQLSTDSISDIDLSPIFF